MNIAPFETEHFLAKYEFNVPYQLCNSDCETVSVEELLTMADISLVQLGEMRMGYTESEGNPHLRTQIADMYAHVAVEDIMLLGTPIEGVYLAARAVLEPDDEVIVLTPAYDALINMFEHVVGPHNVKKWAFQPTAASWTLDLDDLRTLITPKTKLVVVNFPHNPTGYLPSTTQQAELVSLIEQHDLWLFSDEMYYGLVHSGTELIPSMADITQKTIVLSGLSKTYGLPGLRVGWLLTRNQAMYDRLFNWKFYTSLCPPAPSEFLAMAAMRVRTQLRDKNIALIEQNLALAEAFFERWPELFTWRRPMSSSIGLVGMNVPSVYEFSTKLADDAGVLIQSAKMLGYDDQHMRMGFGRAKFGESLSRFESYLSDHYKK
ncbi:MAG: aminotransferase class I/II-fold pyridoxal phosphate-dependent enzyme [Chloroflexota bacterium]